MVIDAYGEDLAAACRRGVAASQRLAAPVTVQWGAVAFAVNPGDCVQNAYQSFLAAARLERLRRESERAHASARA